MTDDADDLVAFEAADLRAALRTVLVEQWRAAGQRQARATEPVILLVDEAQPEADDRVVVDVADVKAAMATALAQTVGREVRNALNRITGRVD